MAVPYIARADLLRFALLKIFFIIFLIILGLVISLGGVPGVERLGFHYWKTPGPFVEYIGSGAWGNFLGTWAVMGNAVFSFAGTESVAMAAAECRNPRQVIPRACKRVFLRVALFYVLSVIVVGMLVASNDPRLSDQSGTAAQSPFVIAASAAKLKAIPSVVNAVVITSAWSSSNQALLSGTRVLYALALKKQAPKVLLRTTSWGQWIGDGGCSAADNSDRHTLGGGPRPDCIHVSGLFELEQRRAYSFLLVRNGGLRGPGVLRSPESCSCHPVH